MTMRLDIVTNDAGELVRREHARELGAGVVVALYRLARLAQMHDLGNQAFLRQLEQTHQMIEEYCLRSGDDVNVLFADQATFVAGQLLKGNRGAYESAAELGAILERLGGSELEIARGVARDDLQSFAEQLSVFHRTSSAARLRLPPTIRLRRVADAARLRGIELEALTSEQRIVRAYASAVVIMRRFYEDLAASRYVLPRRMKRIAQSLVDLSDSRSASFLGVTEVRNANHDDAGRSVNTAILAVAIAREASEDRAVLAQIALAAMMHDVARPRALALASFGDAPIPGMAGPTMLSEDQEDRLAAGAAAVLTALGRVNEPSITRTVLAFEASWLRRRTWLGPVYWGARPPTLQASIIAVARRYNDLLTPEPGLSPPTTDQAVATLAQELLEPQDRMVLRMLVAALGLLPAGAVIPSLASTPSAVGEAMGKILDVTSAESAATEPDRTLFQPSAVGELERPRPAPSAAPREPTARGNLGVTPLPHVLVYMLDHALTGSVVFERADLDPSRGADDTVYFERGVPSKIRLGDRVALLGDVLVEEGVLERATVEEALDGARRVGVVFGEYLVASDLVSRELLAWILRAQLLRRIAHVANLVPAVEYAYYQDLDLLDGWGSAIATSHPLDPVLASVRSWSDRARVHATLDRLGKHPLAVHPDADLSTFVLGADEEPVLDAIVTTSPTLAALFEAKLADPEVVASVVYTFVVTRQLTFAGQAKVPMAGRAILSSLGPPRTAAVVPPLRRPLPTKLPLVPSSRAAPLAASSSGPVGAAAGPSRVTSSMARPSGIGAARVVPQIRPIAKRPTVAGFRAVDPARLPTSPTAAAVPTAPERLLAANIAGPAAFIAEPKTGSGLVPGATGALRRSSKVMTTVKGIAPAPSLDGEPLRELPLAPLIEPAQPTPTLPSGHAALAEVESAFDAMSSFLLAEGALERNELGVAEEHARKAVAGDPGHGAYRALLAWIEAQDRSAARTLDAIRTLSDVLLDDPANEKALLYRARLLVRTKRLPEALNDFNELLASSPDHREAREEADRITAALG